MKRNKNEYEYIDPILDIDYFEIGLTIGIIILFIGIGIFINNRSKISNEMDCVNFYKENHYILKSCENYRD